MGQKKRILITFLVLLMLSAVLIAMAAEAYITYSPSNPVSSVAGEPQSFSFNSNQSVNSMWLINDTTVQTNTSELSSSYTNTSATLGYWNLSVVITNENTNVVNTWWWTVTNPMQGAPQINSYSPLSSTPSSYPGENQVFNVTANQTADFTWYVNGSDVQTNSSVRAGTLVDYSNNSAGIGTYNITVIANNPNGSDSHTWLWSVIAPPGPSEYIPPAPASLTSTEGKFWINYTWRAGAGNVTNSYNVSQNGTWHNDTTDTYFNSSVGPHGWSNVTVWAYNNSGGGSLSLTAASQNTQVANNDPVQNPIGAQTVTAGSVLTFTVSATDADTDTITYSTNAIKGTLNSTTGVYSWTPNSDDIGTYDWSFTSTDNYGGVDTQTVTVTVNPPPAYVPPVPANLASTQGNFWINYTWQAGAGNVTNSYNVSQNGTWHNDTTDTYFNSSVGPHGWSNITVRAYNNSGSGSLSSTAASQNTQVNNNPIYISGIQDSYSLVEGQTLNIHAGYSDADGDIGTFERNFSNGTFDTSTGILTWNTAAGDHGIHNWQISVSDGWGSVSPRNFTVMVGDSTPGTPVNLVNSTSNFWVNYSWQAGANTDTFNVSYNNAWTNGSSATFINRSVGPHGWGNITVYGWNNTVGALSTSGASQNTQVPNNPVMLGNISPSYTVFENNPVSIYPTRSDLDYTDSFTFGSNITKGVFYPNNGTFLWTPNSTESGVYNWYINVSDGYSANTTYFTLTVIDSTPAIPINLTNKTALGNFWVNYTWEKGANTDLFNVSYNGTWDNSSAATFINRYVGPHGWGNITVCSYNASSWQTTCGVSQNTQVPNNPIIISNISDNYSLVEGQTLNIDASYSDADGASDFLTFNRNFTNGSFNKSTGVLTWTTVDGDQGDKFWQINVTDKYNSVSSKNFTVHVDDSTPGTPINLVASTSNFWVNYSWQAGDNTDWFNVSYNGTWTNGSSGAFVNRSVGPHGWGNITVYGWNNTLKALNLTGATNSTQVPNNPIQIAQVIANISDNYTLKAGKISYLTEGQTLYMTEGQNLTINASYTDTDGDTGTFADNSTRWNISILTGKASWNTTEGDDIASNYSWQINVTDGYGAVSAINFTVHVGDSTPGVPVNLSNATGNFWINWTWGAGNNTDDYDVLIKLKDGTLLSGVGIINDLFYNYSTYPHRTRVIWVRTHNYTLNNYSGWVNQATTIPNNPPVINNILTNYTVFENNPVSIYPYATDLDNTYASNLADCRLDDSPCDYLKLRNYTTKGDFNITSSDYVKAKNATFFWTPNSTDGDDPTGSKVYNWNISASDYNTTKSDYFADRNRLSTTIFNFTVTVIDSTPNISQLNFLNTTENFWVNHTWQNVPNADLYNISHNGQWDNVTTNYFNETVGPHGWSNITVLAYNTSSRQISIGVPDKFQVLNNNHTQEVIVNGMAYTGKELDLYTGQVLSFNITTNDADSDIIQFATNAKGDLSPGTCIGTSCTATYTWKPEGWDAGNYTWEFNSVEIYDGSLHSETTRKDTIRVNVKNPLDIQLKFIEPYVIYEYQNENMNYVEAWRDASAGHAGKWIGYNVTFKNKEADYLGLKVNEIYNNDPHSSASYTVTMEKNESQSCPDESGGKRIDCRMRTSFEINSTGIKGGFFNLTLNLIVSGCFNCTILNYNNPSNLHYNDTYTISLPMNPILKIKRAIDKTDGREADVGYVINGSTTTITYVLTANSTVTLTNVSIHDPLYPANNGYINIPRLEANKSNITSYDFPATTDVLSKFKCEGNETCIINMANFTGYDPVKKVFYNDTDYVELCINECYTGTFVPTPAGSSPGYSPSYSSPSSSTSGGSTGGGGGGGVASGEDFNNTERRELREMDLHANSPAVYVFRAADPVVLVSFVSSVSENGVPVMVEVLKNRSKFIGVDAPGKVYKYFNVFVGTSGFSKKVSKGVVAYRVNNSWLEENGFDPKDVLLYKFMDGDWAERDTEIAESRTDYTYYASSTGNFSSFAIVAKKGGSLSSSMPNIPLPVQLPVDELENHTINASANHNLSSFKLTGILAGILGFALPKGGTVTAETLKLVTAITLIFGMIGMMIYYLKRRHIKINGGMK